MQRQHTRALNRGWKFPASESRTSLVLNWEPLAFQACFAHADVEHNIYTSRTLKPTNTLKTTNLIRLTATMQGVHLCVMLKWRLPAAPLPAAGESPRIAFQ